MSDLLVVTALAIVAVGAAGLSLLAWYRLRRRPGGGAQKPQFDSEDPDV